MTERSSQSGPLRQVLGAFYKTVDVMKSARNSESKMMCVWADDMKAVEDVMLFLEDLRDKSDHAQSQNIWQPIETAPAVDEWDTPPSVLLWVADGGGKGSGCHAFGRVYRYSDGTVRAVASGFSGNWRITHWMPLPQGPDTSSGGGK